MHPSLSRQEHRPWPVPTGPWTSRQSWCDLAFIHWPVPAALLRPLVPSALRIQEHDGTAYIGIVPFRMQGVMQRGLPDLPGFSAFPELNVRTYVEHEGRPGVWFLSLDATNRVAVWAARRFFHLPYHRARVAITKHATSGFDYRLERGETVRFEGRFVPRGEICAAAPGSLEHFLTERYCLYASRPDGVLLRVEVHHVPWPLQRAELELRACTMTAPWGIALDGPPPLVHFAHRVDVVVWPARRVGAVQQAAASE
jgi:uncharacterized protein YqjF (DUF2071 family)